MTAPGLAGAAREWQRLRRALAGRRLPAAVVDLDAFDRNVDRLAAPLAGTGKRLRIATKSVRLLRRWCTASATGLAPAYGGA